MPSSPSYGILVVNDLIDNLVLSQTVLETEGYEVETANNSGLTPSKIEALPPDLILIDVMMLDMDGYELTRRIRQNSQLPFMPILLVTAYDRADAIQGLDLGAKDFIRKPIDFDELLVRVRAFLRLKQNMPSK